MEELIKNETNKYARKFYEYVDSQGYTVTEGSFYKRAKEYIELVCPNNHIYGVFPDAFKRGKRCVHCLRERQKESVFNRIESQGYKILNKKDYKTVKDKIKIQCRVGHVFEIAPENISNNHNCKQCYLDTKKDFFYENIKSNGYKLLKGESYKGANVKINLLCPRGHIYHTSPSVFNLGYRCSECSGNKKRSQEDFEKLVYELTKGEHTVIGEYVNNNTPITMRHNNDSCDNYVWDVSPGDFITSNNRCPKCSKKARKDTSVYSTEVHNLTNGEYEVIGEYVNADTPIKMKHNSNDCFNHEWECIPYNFLNGTRCPRCSKPKGEKSHLYDPTIPQEEREKGRWLFSAELQKWRMDVYFRDDFTCQCCFDKNKKNLNAHHLNGYHWDVKNRFNPDNGITLCEECHSDFHKKYGRRNNTKEQFNKYMGTIIQHT